jgi:hypothetical protein
MVSLRYQTRVLSHVVSICTTSLGRYEISIHGPKACRKHTESFALLRDAQAAAHSFAHSALTTPCSCDQIFWTALRERRATPR